MTRCSDQGQHGTEDYDNGSSYIQAARKLAKFIADGRKDVPIASENADSYAGAATGKLPNLWNPWLGERTNTCVRSRALGREVLQEGFHSAGDWILARARTSVLSGRMIVTLNKACCDGKRCEEVKFRGWSFV